MKRMNERGGKNTFVSIVVGVAVALLISVSTGLFMSSMVIKNGIAEEQTSYIITIVHLVASCAGAWIAGKRTGRKYAIVCAGASACYFALLVAGTVLFFESQFSRVGWGSVACAIGAIAACLLCTVKKKGRHKIK